ncbi:MAG TPA: hypothetical protein VEL76_06155 [Gemmataceae bacterium]|nr:hypothetical protein [Gemmataceae bacterium]
MKTWMVVLTSFALLPAFTTAQVPVQQFRQRPPITRPAISPYLSLVQPGGDTALNYYNLVRPQIEFRNTIGQLQLQTAAEQETLTALQAPSELPATGHAVGFQTHRRYFQTLGRTGGVTGQPGGFQAPAVRPTTAGTPATPTPARR